MSTTPSSNDQFNDLLAKIVNRTSFVFGINVVGRTSDGEHLLCKKWLQALGAS